MCTLSYYCSRMTTPEQRRKALAAKIENLRKDRGSTKRHIYTAAGMHQVTYDRRIRGEADFSFPEIIAIADALGVKVSELVEAEESAA